MGACIMAGTKVVLSTCTVYGKAPAPRVPSSFDDDDGGDNDDGKGGASSIGVSSTVTL